MSALAGAEAGGIFKLEASLVYKVNSRTGQPEQYSETLSHRPPPPKPKPKNHKYERDLGLVTD